MGTYQFIDSEGNSIGPVSLDTLRKMRQAGHLGGHTQILDEATKRFLRLDQLLGVAATEGATVLPPPPSSAKTKRYFFADTNNTPVGPFTIEELQRQLIDKKIRAETQIIEEGGTVWQPYANVMMDRLREGPVAQWSRHRHRHRIPRRHHLVEQFCGSFSACRLDSCSGTKQPRAGSG